jgi:choline dehydrogenase-like flavoprotein
MDDRFDVIVVGSGFAGTFFLWEALQHLGPNARVLVLERGKHRDRTWQLKNSGGLLAHGRRSFKNATPKKPWRFSVGVGGSSNCWVGCTPRMLPEDFALKTRYGVGTDWPLTYAELERDYVTVERLMAISGPDNTALFPRSAPYPQPPHALQKPEEVLQKAYPGLFFSMPTARSRVGTDTRGACCNNSRCQLCPIDAKFTILNGLMGPLHDPRVTLLTSARVDALELTGATITGVAYRHGGRDKRAKADFVALGANALFNPALLLASGLDGPAVGKGLVEQVSLRADVFLDGLDGFQGSTYLTGHGYMLYGGEHRREHAAGLIETKNRPDLRLERGKWRQRLRLKVIYEDLPQARNHVESTGDVMRPARATFKGRSEYAKRALTRCQSDLERVLAPLPVESIRVERRPDGTESHIMCSAAMGNDPDTSVVDAQLIHHRVRNLAVLGASAFPTAAPANPTLTLSALSIRSARSTFGA